MFGWLPKVLKMYASTNQRATMKMDMTTCDRMSASSAFIRAAIEATASEHSSWKEFNQTQTSLAQPSLSKASRPSFAFSFLTRETGRGWLPGCSSLKTFPPDQLCSHSDRENIRSNTILNSSCLPFIHRSSMLYVIYFPQLRGWQIRDKLAHLVDVGGDVGDFLLDSCSHLSLLLGESCLKPLISNQVHKVCSSMGNVSTKHWNIRHTSQMTILFWYSRLTSWAMDSLALLTSSPSFLLRSFPFSFRTSKYFSTWTQGRDGHQPEVQAALELLQALSPGFKMSFWHNWCFIKNDTFEKSCLAQMKSPAKQRQAPRKAK